MLSYQLSHFRIIFARAEGPDLQANSFECKETAFECKENPPKCKQNAYKCNQIINEGSSQYIRRKLSLNSNIIENSVYYGEMINTYNEKVKGESLFADKYT